jgi:hypothetical protein
MKRETQRPGFALIVVVFILLALGILGAGLVFIAAEEVAIASAGENLLRTRVAAESAVRTRLATWRTADYRALATGTVQELDTEPIGGPREMQLHTAVERLAGPLYLVGSEARDPGGASARAAVVVWGIEPAELWLTFPAALSANGPVELWGDEAVIGFTGLEPARPGEEVCQAEAIGEIRAVFGDLDRPAILPASGYPAPDPKLGPLGEAALLYAADRVEAGVHILAPVEAPGLCDYDAIGNWGAPASPGTPCAEYLPLIYVPGDLHLAGGAGQGILVVDGDLIISGETRFHGAVVVGGELDLRDNAEISGAVTTAGVDRLTTLARESRITYDPCALQRAFTSAPALNRAFQPIDRGWVPQY